MDIIASIKSIASNTENKVRFLSGIAIGVNDVIVMYGKHMGVLVQSGS
jgi:hypothetical protein